MDVRFSLADGECAVAEYLDWAAPALRKRYPDLDLSQGRPAYVDAGIMNYVYRVDAPGKTFFLKQALDRVKQHDRLGPDLAGVSPARIAAEARALQFLGERLDPRFRSSVPVPAWYDERNNILWTEDAAPDATALQKELESGRCSREAAEQIGRVLGAIHAAAEGRGAPRLWPDEDGDRANWERFLRMRTTGYLQRAAAPEWAAERVTRLFDEGLSRGREGMLSHLDAAPKNVLLAEGKVVLLDYELGSSISDPAYDPGFLAGHYLLMGVNRPEMRAAALAAAAAVRDGYRSTAPRPDPGWERRLSGYAGSTMLYRVYGSSPAPYLEPARLEAIREAALAVLAGNTLTPA